MRDKNLKPKPVETPKNSKPHKAPEISPEAAEERRLLSSFLLDKTEELSVERNKRKERIESEPIELRGGKTISISQLRLLVTAIIQHYPSIFPNDNPFFKHMFRLHPKLMGLDYKKYLKPRLAGKLLKTLTYNRFGIELLPALVVFAMPDGVWRTKCYKHLTIIGVDHLIEFRNQANEMMEKYKDGEWYEFYAEFCRIHRKQPRLF